MPILMKGNTWHERHDKVRRDGSRIVNYPVMAETKYDEIRCEVVVQGQAVFFNSYAGNTLANMQCFASLFISVSKITGYNHFDCGFEVNGNFNDSYRWVRSTKGLPEDLKGAKCQFILFDLPSLEFETYQQRRHEFAWCVNTAFDWSGPGMLCMPEGVILDSEEEVNAHFYEVVSLGYEGLMIKQLNGKYQKGKRTDAWLKMKPEETADGEIIELHEAICGTDQPELSLKAGDRLGRTGSVTVRLEDGSTATPHGINFALGTEMHLNPQAYIGEWVEFKYMMRDRQGGYRHPTFKRLREAKV